MYYRGIVLLLIFVSIFSRGLRGQDQCPQCDCASLSNCTGDRGEDPCDCCNSCGDMGEDCGEGTGECIGNLLCLPNDPYSSDYSGKCYELSDCLSFGCTDEGGECRCLYSSMCPLKIFPYYTIEECKESLLRKRCEAIECPPQPTARDCKDGMYFEQGPSYYDECCPLSGRCVCNVSLCSRPPQCDDAYSELVVIKESNETLGQCCDEYECQRVIAHVCVYNNEEHALNEMWKESPCQTCHCTADGVSCEFMNCPQLEDCEITYVPQGKCCPVCFQPAIITNRPVGGPPSPAIGTCIGEDGLTYEEGEEFRPGPCRMCRCRNERIVCEEKMCGPLVCDDEYEIQVYENECCPKCINKTPAPTMDQDKDNFFNTTMQAPTQDREDIDSPTEETTVNPPSNQQLPSNTHLELVMVLDAPVSDVSAKWNEFSIEVASMLKSYELQAASMDVKESMGKAVLVMSVEHANTSASEQLMSVHLSETELALMISQTAQDYQFISERDTVNNHRPPSSSSLGIDEAEYNATVIVLTLIAAIALVSFIGVFVGVILITRRLKTVKAIRGQNHKRTTRP